MQDDRSLCTTGTVRHENHPQLPRSASGIATKASGELVGIARGGCCGVIPEHHPPVVFHDRADRLIQMVEIRAANIAGEQTTMQFVPRDARIEGADRAPG